MTAARAKSVHEQTLRTDPVQTAGCCIAIEFDGLW
jgi:hypothetical protein